MSDRRTPVPALFANIVTADKNQVAPMNIGKRIADGVMKFSTICVAPHQLVHRPSY
jgi:hypothetical protein